MTQGKVVYTLDRGTVLDLTGNNDKSTQSTLDLLPRDALEGRLESVSHVKSLPWTIGCSAWCRKYFWEDKSVMGSQVAAEDKQANCGSRLVQNHRKLIGVMIPAVLVHFVWWTVMIRWDLFYLFPNSYPLTITMFFASIIAGLTSIGGGAVAFPVLTLLLNVSPEVARDFSLLIQSFGMTGASFTIFFMGTQVDWWAITFGSIGGAVGLLVGLQYVESLLLPAWKKMIFSSFWFSFAFALFLLNRFRKRKTFRGIPDINWWKVAVLLLTGVVGGLFTSFVGAGLDICSLSVLTLFFRVTEKTATPTSIVLMAFNSILGSFWRSAIMTGVQQRSWEFLAITAMVTVIGGPLGSIMGTRLHRQVLASIIYILVTATLVSSFVLIPQTPLLAGASAGIIVASFLVFGALTCLGEKLKRSVSESMPNRSSGQVSSSSRPPSSCSIDSSDSSVVIRKHADNDLPIISHL